MNAFNLGLRARNETKIGHQRFDFVLLFMTDRQTDGWTDMKEEEEENLNFVRVVHAEISCLVALAAAAAAAHIFRSWHETFSLSLSDCVSLMQQKLSHRSGGLAAAAAAAAAAAKNIKTETAAARFSWKQTASSSAVLMPCGRVGWWAGWQLQSVSQSGPPTSPLCKRRLQHYLVFDRASLFLSLPTVLKDEHACFLAFYIFSLVMRARSNSCLRRPFSRVLKTSKQSD
jgi:hypothetical protein